MYVLKGECVKDVGFFSKMFLRSAGASGKHSCHFSLLLAGRYGPAAGVHQKQFRHGEED